MDQSVRVTGQVQGIQLALNPARCSRCRSVFEVEAVWVKEVFDAKLSFSWKVPMELQFPCSSAGLLGCHDHATGSHLSSGAVGLVIGDQNGRRAAMALSRVSHSML